MAYAKEYYSKRQSHQQERSCDFNSEAQRCVWKKTILSATDFQFSVVGTRRVKINLQLV